METVLTPTTNATNAALTTPPWFANDLRAVYARGEAFLSLVHGNTDDYVWRGWPVDRWLGRQFAGTADKPGREVVVYYSQSKGLTFGSDAQRRLFERTLGWPPPVPPEVANDPDLAMANAVPDEMPLPREPDKALAVAFEFLRLARRADVDDPRSEPFVNRRHPVDEHDPTATVDLDPTATCKCGAPQDRHTVGYHDGARSAALVVNHVDLLVKRGKPPMAEHERLLEMLHDAASDDGLINAWNPVVLLARRRGDVDEYVLSAPGMKSVKVPLPDRAARLRFVLDLLPLYPKVRLEVEPEQIANWTAGLQLRHIEDILLVGDAAGVLTSKMALDRQAEIMDDVYGSVLERVETTFGYDALGNVDQLAAVMREEVIGPMQSGDPELLADVPMGMALYGPPGGGKSAFGEATAYECRMNYIRLKNLKAKYVGESEQNVEKLIEGAEMFEPMFVEIDEIDKAFPPAGGGGEHVVDSALRKRLQEWLGDTRKRGRRFVIVMSNYPDSIDPALVRTGRIDLKVAMLPPETAEQRAEILVRLLDRYGLEAPAAADLLAIGERTARFTNSDLEYAVSKARGIRRRRGVGIGEALAQAIARIVPTTSHEVKAQVAAAVRHCNDLDLLPERYRKQREQQLEDEPKAEADEPIALEPAARRGRRAEF